MSDANLNYFEANGPIFIGGLSFSGKTLLRLLISSHPNIAMSRRTYMWPRFYQRYGDLGNPANFDRCLQAMLADKHIRMLQRDPERIRREYWAGPATYERLFALFHEHFTERMGKKRWGDQLGLVERYADPIFAAYPNAKMIHMIRNPHERYRELQLKKGHRIGKIGWETARWLSSADLASRNLKRYSDRYKIVRYEALLTQREKTIRDVCAFIGEDFFPSMLTMDAAIRFGEKNGDESTLGQNEPQVYANIINRDVVFTQEYAKQQILENGYSLTSIRLPLRDQFLFNLLDRPINLVSMFTWRTRHTVGL